MATVDEVLAGLRGTVAPTYLASDANVQEISKSPAIHEFSGRGLQMGIAQGLMSDEEELAGALEKMRGVSIRRDLMGEPLAEVDGEVYALNKEGFSESDLTQLGTRALAYSPQAKIAGGGLKATAKVAGGAGATESLLQGVEWLMGGQFDPEDPLIAAASAPVAQYGVEKASGAIGSVAPKIKSFIQSGLPKAKEYFKGGLSKIKGQDQPSYASEVKSTIEEAAQTPGGVDDIEGIIEIAASGDAKALAKVLDLDEDALAAIREIGAEESLVLSHISNNKAFRELEQTIGAKPTSEISARQTKAVGVGKIEADRSIIEGGGNLDKAEISTTIKSDMLRKIDELEEQSDALYKEGDDIIDQFSFIPVEAKNSTAFIEKMLEKRQGRKKTINAKLMGAYNTLKGTPASTRTVSDPVMGTKRTEVVKDAVPPTYEEMNAIRKKLGQALRNKGDFKDEETGLVSAMYKMVRMDQDAALKGIKDPAGKAAYNSIKEADQILQTRKRLEDDAVVLLGKGLADDVMPKASAAIKGLANKAGTAKIGRFDKFMSSIPAAHREKVATSAVNDLFRGGAARDKELGVTSFASIYNELERQPTAKQALFKHLPPQMQKRFDTLGRYSNSISRALEDRIKTGQINSLLNDMSGGGIIGKLMPEVVAKAGDIAGGKLGISGAGTAAKRFLESQTDQAKKVDSLLSNQKFINDTIKAAEAMKVSKDAEKFQSTIKKSAVRKAAEKLKTAQQSISSNPKFKAWLKTMPKEKQEQIARAGLMAYIMSED